MNRAARKAFLALFVVCVFVKLIAQSLSCFFFFEKLFYFKFFSPLETTGELCHHSIRRSEGLVNDITTLLRSLGTGSRWKRERKPASNSGCLSNVPMKCHSHMVRAEQGEGAGGTWSDGKRLATSQWWGAVCVWEVDEDVWRAKGNVLHV